MQDFILHSNSSTTIDFYTQSPMEMRIAVQEQVLNAILEQQRSDGRTSVTRILPDGCAVAAWRIPT